jgi:hypothetical protein
MKAILEFDLPEEQLEFETANNAQNMKGLVWDFGEQLRGWDKHGHNFKTADDAVDKIRAYFIQCINDYNLDATFYG